MNKCATPTAPQAPLAKKEMPTAPAALLAKKKKKKVLKRVHRNIEDVEDEIQLTPTLSFGLGPRQNAFFSGSKPPTILVNLRKTDKEIWYIEKKKLPGTWKYFHFPMEIRDAREEDEEETYDEPYVLSVAEKLAREPPDMPMFIHAYDSQRAACVIALLVWHLRDTTTIQDPIKKLHTEIFNNEPELTQDFPQYKKQTTIINNIITSRKKTIKKFFENKKQKV